MKRWAFAWILAAAILWLPLPAQAGGPALVAEETTPGGALRPAGQTTVSALSQHLLLDLREREGRIRATYQVKNQADRSVDQALALPVPPWVVGEWKVSVMLDGRPFPIGLSPVPVALKEGELALQSSWIDPFTGAGYQPVRARDPVSPWFLTFGVAFEPGQERQVAVEYMQLPGEDQSRFLEAVRRFDYLLQPARHWDGFGQLRVEVLAPVGVPLRSEPALRPAGPGRFEATFDELPATNLSIFLAPGGGPRWWWDRTWRGWFLASVALAGGVGAEMAGLRWPRAGVLVSLLTWAVLCLVAPPSLLRPDPTGVIFLFLLFIPFLMVIHILCRSLVRRIALSGRNRRAGPGV